MTTTWQIPIILALVLSTGLAYAQQIKDGPHLGFVSGDNVREKGEAFGWQVTLETSPFLSFEFSVSRHEDEFRAADIDTPDFPLDAQIDTEVYAFALTGRLGFRPLEFLYMYGGGGVGYYFFNTDSQSVRESLVASGGGTGMTRTTNISLDTEEEFGFHVGGGIEFHLTPHWEIFVDYRLVSVDIDTTVKRSTLSLPSGNRSQTRSAFSLDYDHTLARVGLNYVF